MPTKFRSHADKEQVWQHDFRHISRAVLTVYELKKVAPSQRKHAEPIVVVREYVLKQKLLTDLLKQMHGV